MDQFKEILKNKLFEEYKNVLTPEDFRDVNNKIYEYNKQKYNDMVFGEKQVQSNNTAQVTQPQSVQNVEPVKEMTKENDETDFDESNFDVTM